MSKKKKTVNNKDKTVKSVNKNLRSSTRKLKPILRAIVGKKVDIAIRNLSFSEKRITHDIKKTISSAVANAENNYQHDIDNLSRIKLQPSIYVHGLIRVINYIMIYIYCVTSRIISGLVRLTIILNKPVLDTQ